MRESYQIRTTFGDPKSMKQSNESKKKLCLSPNSLFYHETRMKKPKKKGKYRELVSAIHCHKFIFQICKLIRPCALPCIPEKEVLYDMGPCHLYKCFQYYICDTSNITNARTINHQPILLPILDLG